MITSEEKKVWVRQETLADQIPNITLKHTQYKGSHKYKHSSAL